MISRTDPQTQTHILYFISTLHFQDSGQIQNGAQDWQTFLMIPKHMDNEVWNQLFNLLTNCTLLKLHLFLKGLTSHYSDAKIIYVIQLRLFDSSLNAQNLPTAL